MVYMQNEKSADMLSVGEAGDINRLGTDKKRSDRFRSLGLTEGTEIKCMYKRKGISAYLVRGALVGIRDEDAAEIALSAKGGLSG